MDLLRNLFGNLTSGIIRLAVAAGVLALCYVFLLKPVLNSVDEVTDKAFESTGIERLSESLDGVSRQVKREIHRSFKVAKKSGGDPKRLARCIEHAAGDVHRIQRCAIKF